MTSTPVTDRVTNTGQPAVTAAEPTANWIKGLFVAVAAVASAVITLITVFQVVHWTAPQTALVVTESGALIGLGSALTVHLLPTTKKEPVALAATFTASVSATLALGTGFSWWHFTPQEISALVGVISSIVGIGGALAARHVVSPTSGPGTPAAAAKAT